MQSFFNPHHQEHATGYLFRKGLPFRYDEVPQRADNILYTLEKAQLGSTSPCRDFGMDPIRRVHDDALLEYLQNVYSQNRDLSGSADPVISTVFLASGARHLPRLVSNLPGLYCFDANTPIVAGTWNAAYWSAQTALSAAHHLQSTGETSYAICRPPGHHASANRYGGYCFLNNAAIAARFLDTRIAILDIDYHHGNGTQEIFYEDPEVYYVSLHADPDFEYPYFWGGKDETGAGAGLGYNLNILINQGAQDYEYLRQLDLAIEAIRRYAPKILIISAGFDILADDPQGGFCLTVDGLQEIGRRVTYLNLPTLIIQEGGYAIRQVGDHALAFLEPFNKQN